MNVCDDNGSFVVFRGRWPTSENTESESPEPIDAAWIDHCRARESAERAAAKQTTCVEARRVHQELAQAYARMIEQAGENSNNRLKSGTDRQN
jgi:hypothetical protein